MDILEEFRQLVRENVNSYMVLEDLVKNTDPQSEYFVIIKEEMLKQYNTVYVEELLDEWTS